MIPRVGQVCLAVALVAGAVGALGAEECAACVEARAVHGWCDACGVGYVGGVRIESERLWHTLDAHGHELNLDSLEPSCRPQVEVDGYCADSRIGFVDGEAFFSRLTWLLAKADRQEPDELACPVCREHSSGQGWCERCQAGRVGVYALTNRKDFEDLKHDLAILAIANEAATRCDRCAAAIVTDTQCPVCRVQYRDGRPVESPGGRE